MIVVQVENEFSEDDVLKYRKNKKKVPAWLYGREKGATIRIKDHELEAHKSWVKKIGDTKLKKASK